ncbi:hypothetical protein V2J09_020281 [Rumex salicifolius]
MQGGRRGGNNLFDPFAGFGGFGGNGSLMSSVFGGKDPFDDPFFTNPFGGSPFRSMFEPSFFGGSPFMNAPSGLLEHQHHVHQAQPHPPPSNIPRGPIIEELYSDDEKVENEGATQRKHNLGKHSRSGKEPFIEYPDDDAEERSRQIQFRNEHNYNMMNNMPSQPQSQSFTFHSSTVTYGGGNGPYYTKSSTRRSGSDGVGFEEHKEADSTTGQALHQVSRGLYNKGHTLTRNLNSDGRVDSMQTLHNLNQEELTGFEQAWNGKARKHLPGVDERLVGLTNNGAISSGHDAHTNSGGWALPSTEHPQPQPHSHPNPKRVRTNTLPASNSTASQSHYSGRRM